MRSTGRHDHGMKKRYVLEHGSFRPCPGRHAGLDPTCRGQDYAEEAINSNRNLALEAMFAVALRIRTKFFRVQERNVTAMSRSISRRSLVAGAPTFSPLAHGWGRQRPEGQPGYSLRLLSYYDGGGMGEEQHDTLPFWLS